MTAVDTARYSEMFARCYVETDRGDHRPGRLDDALRHLGALPGDGGLLHRDVLRALPLLPAVQRRADRRRPRRPRARLSPGARLFPILLTSLIEAADRVDSTTGVQMAYVKQWAPRSFQPARAAGARPAGRAGPRLRGDAVELAASPRTFDVAYLDPPYNQHRYFTNYHVWETLVAWDAPAHYGIACKRVDARDPTTRSEFNIPGDHPGAPADIGTCGPPCSSSPTTTNLGHAGGAGRADARPRRRRRPRVRLAALRRGTHRHPQPAGEKVGKVSHLRNVEYVVVAGPKAVVERMTAPYGPAETPRRLAARQAASD